MSAPAVRPAEAGDRAAIERILRRAGEFRPEEADCAMELLDEAVRDGGDDEEYAALCADEGGEVVGFLCYGKTPLTRSTWDLYWIVTDPDRRRRGAARLMLARMEEEIRRKGATLLVAETSSLPAYGRARAFYEAAGFGEESRIRDFYAPGDDRLIYCRRFD
ncbi:MAG: GNAT family N-acetyltransferase [bacterium]|nr:GNAT family N-acetyltransferase [bacterium]